VPAVVELGRRQIGEPAIYVTTDPNVIVAEYTGASTSKETGLPYRQNYVSIVTAKDGKIFIDGADSATLILTGATDFINYKDVSGDPAARDAAVIAAIRLRRFDALKAEHLADYQKLFNRVSISFGTSPNTQLPTDERIKRFAQTGDPTLVAMLFQYGRYLMIGSSRPGGQPANLQGLWNESNSPPWDSKYTDNINTEMNYWPVEETNLSECHLPLFDALNELAQSGANTAKERTTNSRAMYQVMVRDAKNCRLIFMRSPACANC